MLDIQTGQQDRTNANNSVENIIDFTQDPLSPYAKKEFSLLNVPIVKGLIKFPSIIIPDETPIEAVDRLDILFNRTILVLSRNIPHDPCWIYYRSTDLDGYARHNPSKLTEPEKGFRSDSHLVHRWVYQYLFMPKGIPEFLNDGETILEIDHSCGRGHRGCINPRHLELIDRPTNIANGNHNNKI